MRQSSDANLGSKKTYDDGHGADARGLFEHLEPRQLLALTSPLPPIAAMENQANPVARIITNFGDIDIELYQNTNPSTVANFINYIEDGDYDQFFFHRLVRNFVLQGGGFRYDDADGLSPVPTDPPVNNEFQRSNTARTIAMAKLGAEVPGGGPDSATSQFFINLVNNAANLDNQNGGFTVFAKVLGDISWNVVQGIAGLPIQDLRNDPKFAGQFSGNFQNVPVSNAFQPVPGGPGPTEATLVLVWDIELIKPAGTVQFYDEFVQYPEGFAGSTINEFLPIGNPNSETVFYQVIARAEKPQGQPANGYTWFRDKVIATGSIGANSRGGITISRFGEAGAPSADDLVPQGVPYALEVRSTSPLSVNLSHYDFGSSTGENFVSQTAQIWTFAEASRISGSINQFLVWYNPDAVPVNVSVTFFLDDGTTRTSNVTTDRYRRGGLSLNDFTSIPNNTSFSIQLASTRSIVAALTGYDTRGDATGFTELGISGLASTVGVLPMGNIGTGVNQFVTFFNPSAASSTIITLRLSFSNGSPDLELTPASLIRPAGSQRVIFNLAEIPEVADGRRFTLRYSSPSPVYASTRNDQFADEVRYPIGVNSARAWSYAEGFMDPGRAGVDLFETLSVYNPSATNAANVAVRFLYTDGFVVTENRTLAALGRVDLDIHLLNSILNQGRNNNRFFYSIQVTSNNAVVSQFWHHDLTLGSLQPSGGFGELGTPDATVLRLG